MKQSLSNCIQSYEEMYDWDFYTSSLYLQFKKWTELLSLTKETFVA